MPLRALALAAGISVGTAHAGGFGIPEIGVRRTGMATVIGRPDDPSAIYHNPAGLVLQHGLALYVSMGLSLLDTELRLRPWPESDRLLGATPEADGYYAPVRPTRAMGVIPMLAATYEVLPGRLVVGAAVYVGNATGAAFDADAVTRYHLIDGYVVAPQAVASASYRLRETLSVGASAGVLDLRVHGKREVYPIIDGDYHDSWAASAGVRVHALRAAPRLELMAGAQYDRSPAPPRTVTLDQPSFSHPAAHAGARWRAGRYRFGASYIHYWYLVPTIADSITAPPSNIRGRGDNNIFTLSVEAQLR